MTRAFGCQRGQLAAAWAIGALLAVTAACGGGGPSTSGVQPAPSTSMTTATSTTVRPAPTTTVPKVRTVALGETFSVKVGEAVSVTGAGVSVTFTALVSDSRCARGMQCIQAGNAVITVAVTRPGVSPATLTLGTDGPRSARSGSRSVELISVGRGQPPTAQLKVA